MAWWKDAAGAIATGGASLMFGGGNPLEWTTGQKIDLDPKAGYLPRGQEMYDQAQAGYTAAGGRAAPQAGRTQIAPVRTMGMGGPGRDAQMQVANRLLGIGSGAQMGAGEMAVRRAANQGVAATQAAARMNRGAAGGMGALGAARAAGNVQLGAAGQAAQAASGDQFQALGQAGQVAGQLRGQDIDVQGRNMDAQNQRIFQQAGLDQARNLADVQARLAQQGMNDQMQLAYMAQMFGISQAEMAGLLQREQLRMGNAGQPILPMLMQAGGQVGAATAMASDPKLKRDTRRVSAQIDKMLDKLVSHTYAYKDGEKHGEGRRAGIMTSDLEKSEAGRRLIREMPDGKYVDMPAAVSAALAAVARLNERVRAVEKGK